MASSIVVASPVGDRIIQLEHMIRATGKVALSSSAVSEVLGLVTESAPEAILLDYSFGNDAVLSLLQAIRKNSNLEQSAIIMILELESASQFSKNDAIIGLVDDWLVAPFENHDMQLAIDLLSTTLHEDVYLRRKSDLMERLSNDVSAEESLILRQEKEELIRQIYLVLQQQIRHPMLSILAASEVLKEQFAPEIPAHNIACQIEICAKRIRDILETLGNLKTIVLDDYLYGTTMVDFEKSAAQS